MKPETNKNACTLTLAPRGFREYRNGLYYYSRSYKYPNVEQALRALRLFEQNTVGTGRWSIFWHNDFKRRSINGWINNRQHMSRGWQQAERNRRAWYPEDYKYQHKAYI